MAKFEICIDGDKCKGCELCRIFCPRGLIVVSSHINNKGYSSAAIEKQAECTGCRSCALICPDGAISIYKEVVGDD